MAGFPSLREWLAFWEEQWRAMEEVRRLVTEEVARAERQTRDGTVQVDLRPMCHDVGTQVRVTIGERAAQTEPWAPCRESRAPEPTVRVREVATQTGEAVVPIWPSSMLDLPAARVFPP